jgi:hypothetical protein
MNRSPKNASQQRRWGGRLLLPQNKRRGLLRGRAGHLLKRFKAHLGNGNRKKNTPIPRMAEYIAWYNRRQVYTIEIPRRLARQRKLCVV